MEVYAGWPEVYWEAVPKTWPGGSKASVAKCVVRPRNSTRSVGGRAESISWTFQNQVYVVSQVQRCLAGQRRVNETCQLEVDTPLDRKPGQLTKNWRDVVPSSSSGEKPTKSPVFTLYSHRLLAVSALATLMNRYAARSMDADYSVA